MTGVDILVLVFLFSVTADINETDAKTEIESMRMAYSDIKDDEKEIDISDKSDRSRRSSNYASNCSERCAIACRRKCGSYVTGSCDEELQCSCFTQSHKWPWLGNLNDFSRYKAYH